MATPKGGIEYTVSPDGQTWTFTSRGDGARLMIEAVREKALQDGDIPGPIKGNGPVYSVAVRMRNSAPARSR